MVVTKRKSSELSSRLAQNLAAKRKEIGWTQDQLAESIGVEPETISRFERGITLPSLATLDDLARQLEVRISELLEDEVPTASDESLIITAMIKKLKAKDRGFLMELIRLYCDRH